jgi:ABC-type polysaccharide/polyol phosphate export systems, permease component
LNQEDGYWDSVIEPHDRLFHLNLRDVYRYRDLLGLFVRRDFVSFYKQTILGPLWFFIQPFFTMIIYTFIFGKLAGFSTEGLPKPLFYLAGITVWNYFADTLNKTSSVFRDNSGIFGKVYFPRLIMPLSIVVSNLVKFGVQLLLLVMVMLFYVFKGASFSPSPYLAFFPVVIMLMAAQGLGLGMIISAMTTKYRDLAFLVTFGVQLLMYATPVIYPLSSVPAQYQWMILMNPMTQIIELSRLGLLGEGYFSMQNFGYCILFTFGILFIGVVIFNRIEKHFVDTI